jgi:YegS/Rv2252/BmrU family lipid kinase
MDVSSRNIALLCNPVMEKAIRVTDAVTILLRDSNIAFSIFTAYWPTVWDGFTEAWIIGGDGTLNYFINQYPHFSLPIGLLAAGSGNDLHWMLYGETSIQKQVASFLKGHIQYIDAGSCNGQLFINGVGIGFDGVVVKSMLGKKKLAGKASYLLSVMKNIFLYREKYCSLDFDTTHVAQDCLMISIANGSRYGGGFQVAPKALLTDGLLDLVLVGAIDARQRMRYLPVIERGAHLNLPFISYYQTGQVTIKAPALLHAHLDGEYFSADTFDIRCLVKRFAFLR